MAGAILLAYKMYKDAIMTYIYTVTKSIDICTWKGPPLRISNTEVSVMGIWYTSSKLGNVCLGLSNTFPLFRGSIIRGFTVNCPAIKDGGSLCLIARASPYFSFFYTSFHVTFNSHTLPLMPCRRLTWWCYTDYLYILELVQAAALLGCEIFHSLYV